MIPSLLYYGFFSPHCAKCNSVLFTGWQDNWRVKIWRINFSVTAFQQFMLTCLRSLNQYWDNSEKIRSGRFCDSQLLFQACFCTLSPENKTQFPIQLFICGGSPQHQHWLPHIDFLFLELQASPSLCPSQTHDSVPLTMTVKCADYTGILTTT